MPDQRRELRVEDPLIDVIGAWSAVYNLSIGGMCVVTIEPIAMGEKRTFELVDRKNGKRWRIEGQVVWMVPVGDELRRLGIEWRDLDSDAREWLTRQLGESDG